MSERFLRRAILAFLVLMAVWVGYDYVRLMLFTQEAPRVVTPRGALADSEQTAIRLFEEAAPSTVFVTTLERGDWSLLWQSPAKMGMGSGFVWDQAGHIVTNFHVIDNADSISVRFGPDEKHNAVIVGAAPEYDLAVLRLTGGPHRSFAPLPVGASQDLQVGQTVFAIGNPFGLSRTLTQGIVSALERRLPTRGGREIRGMIQTDAAINPGNSGGPLLDSAGRLVGVNTAIVSDSGAFSGVGFAVPIDVVNRVVPRIISHGRMPRAGIGISALGEEFTAHLDLNGVVVADVLPGLPADRAGLRGVDRRNGLLGDVITHVNGKRVSSVSDLAAALETIGVGEQARLRLRRDGRAIEVMVKVVDIGD